MKVANPIYDVVFKYIMEDNKVAKIILSDLIRKKITHLTLKPQEYTLKLEGQRIVLYRIDFKAKIQMDNGTKKLVLIELQKAKNAADIMRFRTYLGEQYRAQDNFYVENNKKYALPIITIYFLGYQLETPIDIPIIYAKTQLLDHATNNLLDYHDRFIESLTHDSVIVQLPLLKHKRRNELELALSLFDPDQGYEMSIDENLYPAKYQIVIRKLLEAIANEELRKKMQIEDELREMIELNQLEVEELKTKLLSEKIKAEQEKQRAEQLEQEKIDMIKSLLAEGMSIEKVTQIAKIDLEFLKKHKLI